VAKLGGFLPEESALLPKSVSELFGITCFSQTWDIPRMWVDYGDNHRGICLGLEINRQKLTRVRYVASEETVPIPARLYKDFSTAVNSTRMVTPTLHRKFHPHLLRVLTTKLHGWEHEQEWRAFPQLEIAENGMYFSDFRSSRIRLKSVILGMHCVTPAKEIRELVGTYRGSVRIWKVVEHDAGRTLVPA